MSSTQENDNTRSITPRPVSIRKTKGKERKEANRESILINSKSAHLQEGDIRR